MPRSPRQPNRNGVRKRPLGRRSVVALGSALFAFALGGPSIENEPAAEAKEHAASSAKATYEYGCLVQPPQSFLERRTFVKKGQVQPTKHVRALKYFAERFGNAGDDATTKWNSHEASADAKTVKFFGQPISINAKIVPALACVEKRIRKTCTGKSSYTPRAVGGFRTSNTYRGGEVSNHLFGIAVDIDPDRNPCCGCVDPWPSSPLCKDAKSKPVYERTALPKCWVKAFEHFGFDWLGHDELEDTMHFEFLGDPDKIKK